MRKRLTILLGMLALVVGACGGGAATPADSGELVIDLTEFEFNPDNIELKVGQQVTFVLSNEGEKEHEFMIGRDVNTDPGYPNGFEHDFFETTDPVVDPMDALAGMGDMDMDDDMDMGDEEMSDTTMGDMSDEEMGEMDEGDEHAEHAGFMVVREPGQSATITFTPTADSVGEWQIGCFEEDGAHWDDGMTGTLTVVEG